MRKKSLRSWASIPKLELASGYPAYANQAHQEMACINGNDRSLAKKRNAAIPWTVQAARAAHSFPVGNERGEAHYNQRLSREERNERERVAMAYRGRGRGGNTCLHT